MATRIASIYPSIWLLVLPAYTLAHGYSYRQHITWHMVTRIFIIHPCPPRVQSVKKARLSSKINYDVLDGIFGDGDEDASDDDDMAFAADDAAW